MRPQTASVMPRAMRSTSSRPRRWKTMVSSTRFKNSGRKVCLSSAMTASFTAESPSRAPGEKPSAGRFSVMALAPTFEVMTTMVLRKSARRPAESVSLPSSMICSSRL